MQEQILPSGGARVHRGGTRRSGGRYFFSFLFLLLGLSFFFSTSF
jgi:hypothetical protein